VAFFVRVCFVDFLFLIEKDRQTGILCISEA
jgi:hypothetical protein